MAERLYTTPITCCLDGQAHDVTDENAAAGRKAGGRYQALCGHVVLPAALVAPIGRPCAQCATVLAMAHRPAPPTAGDDRPRRQRRGWLWRMLHPLRRTAVDVTNDSSAHARPGARWQP